VFLGAIIVLALAEFGLYLISPTLTSVVVLLIVFFTAFNLLEALLPSLVSRVAPGDCRGTAMGFYSSAQFFGAFLGGLLGGLVQGRFGLQSVFLFAALAVVAWLVLALPMKPPRKLGSYIYKVEVADQAGADRLVRELSGVAGVAEAVVVPEDGLAYLKVDRQVFSETGLPGSAVP
jgi:MFS family permease